MNTMDQAAMLSAVEARSPLPVDFTRASSAQSRVWLLNALDHGSLTSHIAGVLELNGSLNASALERSLSGLLERHEPLRTTFHLCAEQLEQFVLPARELQMDRLSVERDAPGFAERYSEVIDEHLSRPFHLDSDVMLRAVLIRLAEQQHHLVLIVHHIAADGWSLGVLVRDLIESYNQLSRGALSVQLPPLTTTYRAYAESQRQSFSGQAYEAGLEYWAHKLRGLPVAPNLCLMDGSPRTPAGTVAAEEHVRVPAELARAIEHVARSQRATPFMVLLAAFQLLLSKYTGAKDITVGTAIANRTAQEHENLVGLFMNSLALRCDLSADPSFGELLARVRRTALEAFAYQNIPFDHVVARVSPERRGDSTPLFDTLFLMQSQPRRESEMVGLSVRQLPLPRKSTDLALTCSVMPMHGGFDISVEYRAGTYSRSFVQGLFGHYLRLLELATSRPQLRASEVVLLSPAEVERVTRGWNDTASEFPRDLCIHELFERACDAAPGRIALLDEAGDSLSYAELDARANQLAAGLVARGVGPEDTVAVCLPPGMERVVALLGVLKAGGAYVPLDPCYPADRRAFMLRDSGAKLLLCKVGSPNLESQHGTPIWELGSERADLCEYGTERVGRRARGMNLAYAIYTSGSTGLPKGVQVEHSSVVSLLTWFGSHCGTCDLRSVLAATSFSWDPSVFELFACLAHGGTLVLAKDALGLVEHANKEQVTLINTVPSAARELERLGLPQSVQTVVLAGEALPRDLAHLLLKREGLTLYNFYGPTEATIFATFERVDAHDPDGPTIGRPVGNTTAYVVDEALQLVLPGAPGELCLGGVGITRGYANRPALTAERFIPDRFGTVPGRRLYCTGDRVRQLSDGRICFLGRLDHQVKVRGHRIELGEVESALRKHAAVADVVVAAKEAEPAGKRLVAYVVEREAGVLHAEQLAAHLAASLPAFMLPEAYVFIEQLPRDPSGKLNRSALPKPERWGVDTAGAGLAPRNDVERAVAGVFRELLGVDCMSAGDNFFTRGGHSLLATRLVSRLNARFGVDVPLSAVFASPTVGAISDLVATLVSASVEHRLCDEPILAQPPRLQGHPLSFAQLGLWVSEQFSAGNAFYHTCVAGRIHGALDVAAFRRALEEIVRRHEPLRTVFGEEDGEPVQSVLPPAPLPMPLLDLSQLPPREGELRCREIAAHEAAMPFDLAKGPLLRVQLLRLGEDVHVGMMTVHHIAWDGWSASIFFRELNTLYDNYRAGQPSSLKPLPIRYIDYAHWQRDLAGTDRHRGHLQYWLKKLANPPPAIFASATETGRNASAAGSRKIVIPAVLCAALRDCSRAASTTLFVSLLTAFKLALHLETGRADVCVASIVASRTRQELEELIGVFVNTLILRTTVQAGMTAEQLLARVRDTVIEAHTHQALAFDELVHALPAPRSYGGGLPAYGRVLFTLQNAPKAEGPVTFGRFEPLTVEHRATPFDLVFEVTEHDDVAELQVLWRTAACTEARAGSLIGAYLHALEWLAASPAEARLTAATCAPANLAGDGLDLTHPVASSGATESSGRQPGVGRVQA